MGVSVVLLTIRLHVRYRCVLTEWQFVMKLLIGAVSLLRALGGLREENKARAWMAGRHARQDRFARDSSAAICGVLPSSALRGYNYRHKQPFTGRDCSPWR